MATTGNTGWLATSNSAIKQKMSWRITPGSASSNKSTVEVWYYLKKNQSIQNSKTYSTDSSFTISVAGQTYREQHVYKEVPADNAEHVIVSKSFSVSHKSDGTMSATISVAGGLVATSIASLSVSKTVTFPQIQRASTITSAANRTLGTACSIKWTPYATSFYYKLKFSIGSWSYTTGAIHPNTTSAYTYTSYTIPTSVANQITNATTGTMTATLYTYSDSACKTVVGSGQAKTFTVTVPSSMVPSIDTLTITKVNSNQTVAGWNIGLEGFTRYRIQAAGSSVNGATVTSYVISDAYSNTVQANSAGEIDFTGAAITGFGTRTFSVVAVDSRGRSSAARTENVTVYPYTEPVINLFMANRNTSTVTSVDIRVDCAYASCNNNNTITATLKYKQHSASAYTTYGTIAVNSSITAPLNLSAQSSYDLRVEITDALGGEAIATAEVPTEAVLLDFRAGGRGLGIGKVAESDRLEVGLDSNFIGDVYIDDVLLQNYIAQQQGTSYGLSLSGHTLSLVSGGTPGSVTLPDDNTRYTLSGQDLTAGYQLTLTSSGTDSSSVTIGQLTEQDIDDILFGT